MEIENIVRSENVTTEMEYELMDTSETPLDGLIEEGEVSSSENEYEVTKGTPTEESVFTNPSRNYSYPSGGFVTGFNIFNKDEAAKKIDRAKRFSIPIDSGNNPQIQLEELENLHRDLGIDKDSEKHFRFNAIHMRGTDDMSTEDVFQYFEHFAPSHVQWINDKSCNVVWMDEISAARALLHLSKRMKNLDKIHLNANPFEKELREGKESDEEMNEDDDGETVDAKKVDTPIPPGYWRLGVPTPKSSCILLRYATRFDKKQHNAEKNSEYYKKYGNPHYGNQPGIFSNSLRLKKFNFKKPSDKWKHRLDKVIDKKNPWKDLAYTWGKAETQEVGLSEKTYHSHNIKKQSLESDKSSKYVTDLRLSLQQKKDSRNKIGDEDWGTKLKVPRMKMHADDEEQRSSSYVIKYPVVDLRRKINKKQSARNKFVGEREMQTGSLKNDSSNSESDEEDDKYDLEGKKWLAKHRHQYRQEKVDRQTVSIKEESESDVEQNGKDGHKDSGIEDDSYKISLEHLSPLTIEIDNDEYYKKK